MPYRLDIDDPPADALNILIQWGALDIEATPGGWAAILPDGVEPDAVAAALGVTRVAVSTTAARDNGSTWLLHPQPVQIGSIVIAPPERAAPPNALRLIDAPVFGSGYHPTTALCLEILEEILQTERPNRLLDVGTGSGILALAALKLGVSEADALDIETEALQAAAENARLNHLNHRLHLTLGSPDMLKGHWPLIVANVLAAPLITMAPVLVQRLEKQGRLLLSGISWSLASEVQHAYEHGGLQPVTSKTRAGWTALLLQASW